MAGALTTEEMASLYRRHVKTVYQISRMLLKNSPDAEDAVQTVFRKAMERDEPFDGPDHERAWLIVTARNECKNQLRHWWRTRRADGTELDNLTWEQRSDGELWERYKRRQDQLRRKKNFRTACVLFLLAAMAVFCLCYTLIPRSWNQVSSVTEPDRVMGTYTHTTFQ